MTKKEDAGRPQKVIQHVYKSWFFVVGPSSTSVATMIPELVEILGAIPGIHQRNCRRSLLACPQFCGGTAVARASGIILANDVIHDCTDHNQLQPQVEVTEENLGGLTAS